MKKLVRYLHTKYNVSVSVALKYYCFEAGEIHKYYSVYIAGEGTKTFRTVKEIKEYVDKMTKA